MKPEVALHALRLHGKSNGLGERSNVKARSQCVATAVRVLDYDIPVAVMYAQEIHHTHDFVGG